MVAIMEYDPSWPRLFEEEKTRILVATGNRLTGIEHVGSTAVPGLAAKPIIDIMGGVRQLGDVAQCISALGGIGYEYVPQYEVYIPERRYFRKPQTGQGPRTHHLHIVETSSDFWQRHLLFRDYLRAHPEVAREYCDLKRRLAGVYGDDGWGYTEAKTAFIQTVVARAARELPAGQEVPERGHN